MWDQQTNLTFWQFLCWRTRRPDRLVFEYHSKFTIRQDGERKRDSRHTATMKLTLAEDC